MEFIDTHCHIHFPDYELDPEEVITAAKADGVKRLIAVGCTLRDSELGIKMAQRHDNIWASIGIHPHESGEYVHDHHALQQLRGLGKEPKVVAVGETGLDYHYMHSSKSDQQKMFRYQLDIAKEHNLPLIFHVREAAASSEDAGQAFDDFFEILDDYKGIRGVVHSFSSNRGNLSRILDHGLYVGLNGIMTFTKDQEQQAAAKAVPLEKLLLETDAPFLTPVPYRGTICEPKHVVVTAKFLSDLRGETLEELAAATTHNAKELFKLA
ncbi:MAG: TatD family hydrolase [Candidatus Saccharibacteria bacterium]|nr:TatD family hydrolase [Candidatus Saccharibacteria bacterium]